MNASADNASSAEANARLAMTLAGIIHLTKDYTTSPTGQPVPRYTPRCLLLDRNDPGCTSVIGKIRDGHFMSLGDDITAQALRRIRNS